MQPHGCMFEEIVMDDDVFRALADPSRRRLLDSLNAANGQTLRELCAGLDMARQSVSKHLGVLERANLVTTLRRGREKLHYLNAEPINAITERWISHYDRGRVHALADLKTALEQPPMGNNAEFVYTTYIRTTQERLWQALTDPAFTSRYWGATLESDWKEGSPYVWKENGATMSDPDMKVVESDPHRRLAYTWHTYTDEWAAAFDVDEELRAKLAAETRSQVSFDLEPQGEVVKLTVVHSSDDPQSTTVEMVASGWPTIIASLKSLLETGEPLATT